MLYLFLNHYIPEFSDPQNPENVRPHSSNSYKNATAIIVNPVVKMRPHLAAHAHYPTTRKYHPSPRIYQTEKRTALDMPENPAVFINRANPSIIRVECSSMLLSITAWHKVIITS